MEYPVIVRPEAEDDLKEAFSWYEARRVGLGYDFLLQVDEGLKIITRNPEAHRIDYKRTRKHLIKRFPYKIIYFIEEKKIIILAVIHGSRSSKLIKKRINGI